MIPSGPQGALLVGAGALMALDHSAWPSLLFAQPLVSGALAGTLLGEPQAGLAAGAVVQMLTLRLQPVGGVPVAEAWVGGMAAALAAPAGLEIAGRAWLDDVRLAPAVAVGVLAMWLGRQVLVAQRRLQSRLAAAVAARLATGDLAGVPRAQALGLLLHAGRGAVLTACVLLAARPLGALFATSGLAAPAGRLALAIAAASLAYDALRRRRRAALGVGALAGLGIALFCGRGG